MTGQAAHRPSAAAGTAALRDTLICTPVSEAVQLAEATWEKLSIWEPAVLPVALASAREFADTAGNLRTMGELEGRRELEILNALSGATARDARRSSLPVHARHWLRNVHVALRGTVALGVIATSPRRRPIGSFVDGLVPLGPRSRSVRRPPHDDEVAVLRLAAEAECLLQGRRGPVTVALTLAGLTLTECGKTRLGALHGGTVNAPGCQGVRPREVPVPAWTQRINDTISGRMSRRFYAAQAPVAYAGLREPGGAACSATLSVGVVRLLRMAGIDQPGVRPGTLPLWRPDHLIRVDGDIRAALHVSGRQPDRLMRLLGFTIDEALAHTGHVQLRSWQELVVATVPTDTVALRRRASRRRKPTLPDRTHGGNATDALGPVA